MKFGIFSNGLRRNKIAADSYDADLAEIVAADRLGFDEAWVSEHIGSFLPDCVANAELLIAKAAGMTDRIVLGPAVRLLPLYHPLDVAASAAMCDHMLRGRYIFGFGSGVPFVGNMQRRGMTNELRRPMMLESIEFILKCWTAAEPFDWDGRHWRGTGIKLDPKPYQRPHPPIAVATGQEEMVRLAAERGWTVMISQFATPEAIAGRADTYCAAAAAAGAPVDRNRMTVARHIHVGHSVQAARDELRADVEAALDDWKQLDPQRFNGYLPASGRVEDVSCDQAFESGLFIGGDPDTVYRQLKEVYDRAGGFGTLLVVMGKDWASAESRARSLALFAAEVAPRLAALDANAAPRPAPGTGHGDELAQSAVY